jgi:hypothetical protein
MIKAPICERQFLFAFSFPGAKTDIERTAKIQGIHLAMAMPNQ